MRESPIVLAILVIAPVFSFSQSPEPKTHSKITGCLEAPANLTLTDSWMKTESQTRSIARLFAFIPMLDSLLRSLAINPQRRALILVRADRRLISRLLKSRQDHPAM